MTNKKTLTFQGFNLNKKYPFNSCYFFADLKSWVYF